MERPSCDVVGIPRNRTPDESSKQERLKCASAEIIETLTAVSKQELLKCKRDLIAGIERV